MKAPKFYNRAGHMSDRLRARPYLAREAAVVLLTSAEPIYAFGTKRIDLVSGATYRNRLTDHLD